MKDADGDGAGDRVFLRFTQPLEALPSSVEAQWNTDTSAFRSVTGANLSFAGTDRAVVVADYSAGPAPTGPSAGSAI